MNEFRRIIQAIDDSDEPCYLATVVDVVGSSYRRPSARMLILPDGSHLGTISGGCLERDLCRAAPTLAPNDAKLVSFDTRTNSANYSARYNVGCSGIIYVLVQRVTKDHGNCPSRFLRTALDSARPVVASVVYQSEAGTGYEVGQQFSTAESVGVPRDSRDRLENQWEVVRSSGTPCCCEFETAKGATRMLIERIDPPKPVWIFGAGDDARPLASMGHQLGWEVTVIDHRASSLTRDRFPYARLLCQPWDAVRNHLRDSPQTAAVLMTHSFSADSILLPWLMTTGAHYVGVLGPKSRTGKLMQTLHQTGNLPRMDALDRMHTPIGLDLGGSTPAEIAISILGEMIAVENQRSGGMLRLRNEPLHEPVTHVHIDCGADRSHPLQEL